VTITTFFDEEANPTRVAFHLPFHGTLTNEATGESVSADQVLQETDDLEEGTASFVGLRFRVTFQVWASSSSMPARSCSMRTGTWSSRRARIRSSTRISLNSARRSPRSRR
jgi:hypothetical protein